MKVAIISESPGDERAIRILSQKLIEDKVQFIGPPIRVRG
jgi:hypothetical protein